MRRQKARSAPLLVLAISLAACSEGKPSAGGAAAPPAVVDTAFAVCAPDAGGGMCTCEDLGTPKVAAPAPAAPTEALAEFLRRLGKACAAKDFALLARSVRFPLSWRAIVDVKVPGGPPITELRSIASPEQLCARNVFADIEGVDPANPVDPDAGALGLTERGSQCRVETLVGQFSARLVLERSVSGWTLVAVEAGD